MNSADGIGVEGSTCLVGETCLCSPRPLAGASRHPVIRLNMAVLVVCASLGSGCIVGSVASYPRMLPGEVRRAIPSVKQRRLIITPMLHERSFFNACRKAGFNWAAASDASYEYSRWSTGTHIITKAQSRYQATALGPSAIPSWRLYERLRNVRMFRSVHLHTKRGTWRADDKAIPSCALDLLPPLQCQAGQPLPLVLFTSILHFDIPGIGGEFEARMTIEMLLRDTASGRDLMHVERECGCVKTVGDAFAGADRKQQVVKCLIDDCVDQITTLMVRAGRAGRRR